MTQSGHQGCLTQPRVILFFFGGIFKSKVFRTPPTDCLRHHVPPRDINDLRGIIITEVDALRGQRDMIRYVFQGMRARVEACV